MGKKTRGRRQPQQLVSRIEKDLGELLSNGSFDRESVRTALEHVHALRNGGVLFPEETLSGYIKRTRPGYTANHTPGSASVKLANISKAVHEAGLIRKRRKKVRGTKLVLLEGDVEKRMLINEFLDTAFDEHGHLREESDDTIDDATDGIDEEPDEEVELLTDYLRETKPTYFTKLTKTSAYNKAIQIANELHEAGIIERREPIGAATFYLDEGDKKTRKSIDAYLNENLTEKGIKKRTELLTEYLRKTRPTYFTGLTEPSAKTKAARLANKLRKAGIIKKRKPIGNVIFYLDKKDKKTRKSIDAYLDENLTENEGGEKSRRH